MYYWRTLTPEQRQELLEYRIKMHFPWHSPPILFNEGRFHLSASCYEHKHHIGFSINRIEDFSQQLLDKMKTLNVIVFAWTVLPNHYHILIETEDLKYIRQEIGKLHGRLSREWNLEEDLVGRKVWHSCNDRLIRSERHYWATINYINNNSVHHGYVSKWHDWPFSSASDYIHGFVHLAGVSNFELWKRLGRSG